MTKKEWKAAMLRGLGRGLAAVEQEPEKYRETVLWACRRNIAYDAQCEGTRSWYVYAMVNAYADKEPFIHAAAEALKKYRPNIGWDLLHLSELLMFLAEDGYDSAKLALEEKYQELLSGMYARKRRPSRLFPQRDDLEQMGLVLAVDTPSFLRIAGDFGRLYREKSYMRDGDFPWFFAEKGKQYGKALAHAAKKDENIACFLEREQASVDAREKDFERWKTRPPEKRSVIWLSRWLATQADKEVVERYALAYRENTQPELRAKALAVFQRCPYPDDPQPVMEDTQSTCEKLRNMAWRVLEQLRHPAVRAFALKNAAGGIHTPENFALLVTNYVPEDGKLLEDLLRERIAAGDREGIHEAGMDIIRFCDDYSGIPHPKHLLPLVYEYTPCSFCRSSAVRHMSSHRMLTAEILEECLYDSKYDLRRYAAKRLKR